MTELVSPDGSPFVVSAGTDWRGFPGSAWLEDGPHGIGSKFLLALRQGTSAGAGGDLKAAICTVTDDDPWTYTIGAPFTVANAVNDLRCDDGLSMFDDTLFLAAREQAGGINSAAQVWICDDPASVMTGASGWTKHLVDLGAHTQNLTSGRVHKLQNGSWLLGYYVYAGSTPTAGVVIVSDPTDWSAPTNVVVGAGFTEINVEELPDGTLLAHLRDNSLANHYGARSTDGGLTWTAPTLLYAGTGFPMFRALPSGILLAAHRHAPSGATAWRWAPDFTDTGWTTEATLPTDVGRDSAYTTWLQFDDFRGLLVYALQTPATPSPLDADIYSEVFTDLTVTPTGAVGWDAYAAADPNGAIIETIQSDAGPIDGATGRAIRIERDGPGSGTFKINRYSPVALESVLARDNLVKCRFPWRDDYDFAWLLEKGDFTLASADEKGGEEFTFGGRGALAYLERAIMDAVAYTTGLDISDTWTEIWAASVSWRPTGTAFLAATPGYVYAIGEFDRRIHKIDQATQKVVASSPVLWSGSTKLAGGLSADPADPDVMWALEAPWFGGYAGNTKIRKIDISGAITAWAVTATIDLGSAIKHTAIKADATVLWLTRYDGTASVYKRSKTTGANQAGSPFTIAYGGVNQSKAVGISVNGTSLAYWFAGTKRALIADSSAPATVTDKISTGSISAFGGDWSTEGGQDYFYMDSYTAGKVWKYQITAATPHDPVDGIWRLDEGTPGAILWRIIQEGQAAGRPQQPLPDLTYDFTSATDTDGHAWSTHDGTLEFDARITDTVLAVALKLLPYGLIEQMSPYLKLGAYNASTFGVDRTGAFGAGVVRFEKGVNIIPELGRQERSRPLHSHMLAVGKGGLYARATLADLGYVREGGISTELQDATALEGTAEATLDDERVKSERIRFAVPIGDDEDAGDYLPFTHYNAGDLVTLHTGTGQHDFNEETFVLYAFSLEESESGTWERAVVELGSATLVDTPTSGGATTSSSGGSGGAVIPSSSSLKVTDGADIEIPGVTTIQAEGAYSPSPGVAVIPIPESTAPLAEELLTEETDTATRLAPDGAGGVEFRKVDVEELTTSETDTSLVAKPDGAGGVEFVELDSPGIVVGTVTPDGSPQAVSSGSDHRGFPGLAWLDATHVLMVYRHGATHLTAGDIVGRIGTVTSTSPWTFSWSAEFTILHDATEDLRCEDAVSVIDDTIYVVCRRYNGSVNHDSKLLICDDPASSFTSGSTWTSHAINLTTGTERCALGRLHKLENGEWAVAAFWFGGGTYAVGLAKVSDPTDWSSPTQITIVSGATARAELDLEEMPSGEVFAHVRVDSGTFKHESYSSTDHGDTWSGATTLWTGAGGNGLGWPMFRRLTSGIGLSVYRSNNGSGGDTAYRQTTTADTDTGWGAEVILDATGFQSSYATLLQLDDNHVLCGYAIEPSSGADPTDSDIYTQIFTDSTVFASSGTVRVSGADTTPEFLETKLVAGANITITKLGAGGDEQLEIASTSTGPTFATPAFTYGTAAAAGSSGDAVQSDATLDVFDATAPTTSALGDAAAAGSAGKAARRDHRHGREALGTTAQPVGTSAGGSATTPSKSDHVHATGAGTPTTSAVGDAAATGSGPAAAMTNHVHGREGFGSPVATGAANSDGVATTVARSDHVHQGASSGPPFTFIGQETRTSDGSTVTWTLDNDFEENSVQAFNLTSGKALAVTETVPNTVTIAAAGTAGDVLSFAYAASAI